MATEKWKQARVVKQLKGDFRISESGRIKRNGRHAKTKGHWIKERFLTPGKTKKGYLRIVLRKDGFSKSYYIHRLVALAFVDNPDGKPCVNHLDGNKLNNHYTNLQWCTPQENNEHGFKMGLLKRGKNIKPYVSKRTEWGGYSPVIDMNTGVFYKVNEVANLINKPKTYVMKMLRGERPNKTRYRYA